MSALGLGLGLGLGRSQVRGGESPDNDMILVYAIPSASTDIELAIQAKSSWFSAGQEVVINWGDGSAVETVSATSGHTGYVGHTYTAAGTYKVKISGSMKMYGRGVYTDALKGQELLTRVDSFGKLGITSFSRAFLYCSGLMSVPRTLPDGVTNMYSMFGYCSGAIFNPDVSNWNVRKVTNMYSMFRNCSGAAFNPDVSKWDVSEVTDMAYMFYNCYRAAFRGGRGGDGIGIANWRLKTGNNAVDMVYFMTSSKTQEPAFLDEILNAWAALHADGLLPTNITVDFGTNKYTAAGATAYTTLTNDAGWTISSGGLQS